MYVQRSMSTLDDKIYMQSYSCKNLKERLDRLEQISNAPAVYVQLCAEVYRRRQFNSVYESVSDLTNPFGSVKPQPPPPQALSNIFMYRL